MEVAIVKSMIIPNEPDNSSALAEKLLREAIAKSDEGFTLDGSSSLLVRWHGQLSDLAPALPRPDAINY